MSVTYFSQDLITTVKGIGPATAQKVNRLNIFTVGDLIKHFPRSYLDFSKQVRIKELKNKEPASFIAEIDNPKTFYSGSGKLITQATAKDDSGKIILTWFNNPYIKKLINEGVRYSVAGKPSFFGPKLTIISPMIEEGDSFSLNTQGMVPVYPLTEGLTSKWLRKKIYELLHSVKITEPLEKNIVDGNGLLPLGDAILKIHFPKTTGERWAADRRLSYNEHLRINIQNYLQQKQIGKSISINSKSVIDKKTTKLLPFELTISQRNTVKQIEKDLSNQEFTHRLIQGETGSGKTAPLIFAVNQSLSAGFSCIILAPTEILATQHFQNFQRFCLFPHRVKLVTALVKANIDDKATVFIGTHALLNQIPKNISPSISFVAIDEQHKFGVAQRDALLDRTPVPHLFNLSATPIPRTLALGLLGDIAISNLRHKPSNRLPVKTFVVSPTKFKDSPKWLIKELKNGNQIYAVCPNILENSQNISSVDKQAGFYRKILPAEFKVFKIHGKISSVDQQKIISDFKNTPGSVLVSTSLIEVGIDIPSANIMIIHSAERFGLAQLHQLRGRVGRGEEQGYCFLVPGTDDEVETERLKLLQKYHDGLVLSRKDLRLRGAGQIYGEKQHGAFQTRLKYFWSKKLFVCAKKDAKSIVKENALEAERIARNLVTW